LLQKEGLATIGKKSDKRHQGINEMELEITWKRAIGVTWSFLWQISDSAWLVGGIQRDSSAQSVNGLIEPEDCELLLPMRVSFREDRRNP
jgi:hypothetical protein